MVAIVTGYIRSAYAIRCALALGCCAPLGQVSGQSTLPDPTRPPAIARAAESRAAADAAVPVLQSILIARDRRSAVISGETVTVGARYGAMRVMQIGETEVVLKGGEGVVTLKLFPQVDKKSRRGHPQAPGGSEQRKTGAAMEIRDHAV